MDYSKKQIDSKKIVCITIVCACIIRVILKALMSVDVNCDEAMLSINSKSIADSGKDIYGTSFPVYFESWAWSGQSALPTYLCAIFVKIFGYKIGVVRLPFLLLSLVSIIYFYKLNKLLFDDREAMVAILLLAICPWHIVQQMIALDCNMFPHFFIIGLYYLVNGIKNNKSGSIYFSMIIFALSLYCYGTSIFFIPIFLLVMGIREIKTGRIKIGTFILSIIIFTVVCTPIVLMYVVNFLKLDTIKLGVINIQRFEYQKRSNDILFFSNNIIVQLLKNIISLLVVFIAQADGCLWNYVPWFGAIYIISIVFVFIGMKNKDGNEEAFVVKTWFAFAVIMGVILNGTNINKQNIFWYVLVILCARGIIYVVDKYGDRIQTGIIALYCILFIAFMITFTTTYNKNLKKSFTFSQGYVESIRELKNEESIYISKDVYKTSDKYIYALFEIGKDKDYVSDRKVMAEYKDLYEENEIFDFDKRIHGVKISDNIILEEKSYIVGKEDIEKISNIDEFDKKEFVNYYVLIKK
ncbi:glycosyltransferase family 39 protein [Eubacterium sp.]|uniref:ArnT family glycosyltransferase n=1 Tax=Eubacterium sp. TaxID=142586 RepID=UPI0025E60BF5|nr:glycosyltransferase family 39 protein [Eubacterium sp.]MCR5628060.1 glycosyltransferase family 39 protein [Eubacterium sp.]